MSPPEGGAPSPRIEALEAAATTLELEEPELVATATADCVARAERELRDGTPRGKAYVLGLRDLTVEQQRQAGIGAGTVRLSIGLEDADALLEDLQQALLAATQRG